MHPNARLGILSAIHAPPPVQSAAPLAEAVRLLRVGARLPRALILALLDEGHDITGLIRSIKSVNA